MITYGISSTFLHAIVRYNDVSGTYVNIVKMSSTPLLFIGLLSGWYVRSLE